MEEKARFLWLWVVEMQKRLAVIPEREAEKVEMLHDSLT